MDREILARIEEQVRFNPNYARILNRDLRPVLQYANIHAPNAASSNLFIYGVPYGLDQWNQFQTIVYAIFQRRVLGRQTDDDVTR
jgi:hypothetical protein